MDEILKNRFQDANYIPKQGDFGENRLIATNHICIQGDCVLFEDLILPYGDSQIEEKGGEILEEIIQPLILNIQKAENRNKQVVICGADKARILLGRKLEDRLKREVEY